MRHLAKLLCLAVGAAAGYGVWSEMVAVFTEPPWLPYVAGAITLVAVYLLLYFPLFRPIADVITDRASALNQRFRGRRMGTGLDEVPQRLDDATLTRIKVCSYCGGPGGPVCERCHEKLIKGGL